MSLLRPIKFLPEGREGSGLLPWVIAVMVFLCSLATAMTLGLNDALAGWSADLERQLTVQVVADDPAERQRQAEAATALLRTTPGVESARMLTPREIEGLLEPWLGAGNVTDDLPVPLMVEVRIEPGRQLNTAALAARLEDVAKGARIDDHEQWIGRLLDLTATLRLIATAIVGMIILTTIAIVAFGTRAGLASHRDSVKIMHLMGADDGTIAGEFQYRYLLHGLKGGAAGLLIAAITLAGLANLVQQIEGGLLPEITLDLIDVAVLIALPLGGALLTMLTARLTVTRELARML